ncbi:GNAT family N-acetyltransferase [Corticicoccus populi]|uniref:GNAT family N-acetyltransferase n=1 Tax=Corticicoccus populi TaxID=1812821 RepID=A0ABW5WUY9_9STAP
MRKLPKVWLRDVSYCDVEERYQWFLDKEVIKYLNVPQNYPPFTKEQTREWITQCINRTNGYEQKAIITEENQNIGWIDLKNIDSDDGEAELGIVIGDRGYWGRGYASSAMKEMLHYGFNNLNLEKIWLRVDADNQRAIKSYTKFGYREVALLKNDRIRHGKHIDRFKMEYLKSDFQY